MGGISAAVSIRDKCDIDYIDKCDIDYIAILMILTIHRHLWNKVWF